MPRRSTHQRNENRSLSTYEQLEAEWKQTRTSTKSELRPDSIDHVVTAGRLMDELVLLYNLTRDVRFHDARKALWQNELLTSRGAWRKNFDGERAALARKGHYDNVALIVWGRIKSGTSIRRACAESVAVTGIGGHSFEATCKEVERLYRSYVKAGVDFGQLEDEFLSQNSY
jgi:hypothetical protein